jgi:hypothetical protein
MNRDLLNQRLQAGTLSLWELGDLLGVHPHHLHTHDTAGGLVNQPVRVLIDLARQLDMHPAGLIAGLEPVRANRRESASCEPDAGPDHDALTVLTCPLPHRQGRGYPVIWSWRCRTAS